MFNLGLTMLLSCGKLVLFIVEDTMQVRERRTCSVVYSPVGTGDSLLGFFCDVGDAGND